MISIFSRQSYNQCISFALIKVSDKTHILLKSKQDYASLLSVTLVTHSKDKNGQKDKCDICNSSANGTESFV